MKEQFAVMPKTQAIMTQVGEQIQHARLRRKLSVRLVAERAGISEEPLDSVENGSAKIPMGAYAAVLHALNGMDTDLLLLAKDEEFRRKLQDLGLN